MSVLCDLLSLVSQYPVTAYMNMTVVHCTVQSLLLHSVAQSGWCFCILSYRSCSHTFYYWFCDVQNTLVLEVKMFERESWQQMQHTYIAHTGSVGYSTPSQIPSLKILNGASLTSRVTCTKKVFNVLCTCILYSMYAETSCLALVTSCLALETSCLALVAMPSTKNLTFSLIKK